MKDQQKLPALLEYYRQYKLQVDQYVEDCQSQELTIDNQLQRFRNERLMLDKKINDNPLQSSTSRNELTELNAALNQEELQKEKIEQNVSTALTWVRYLQAQINNAEYEVREDQQQLAQSMEKAQQARLEQNWQDHLQSIEARKMQRQQDFYHDPDYDPTYDDDYIYGGSIYARGRSPARGRVGGNQSGGSARGGGGSARGSGGIARGGGGIARGGGGGGGGHGGGGHR